MSGSFGPLWRTLHSDPLLTYEQRSTRSSARRAIVRALAPPSTAVDGRLVVDRFDGLRAPKQCPQQHRHRADSTTCRRQSPSRCKEGEALVPSSVMVVRARALVTSSTQQNGTRHAFELPAPALAAETAGPHIWRRPGLVPFDEGAVGAIGRADAGCCQTGARLAYHFSGERRQHQDPATPAASRADDGSPCARTATGAGAG